MNCLPFSVYLIGAPVAFVAESLYQQGAVECGTGRSSMGQIGLPVTRSKRRHWQLETGERQFEYQEGQ